MTRIGLTEQTLHFGDRKRTRQSPRLFAPSNLRHEIVFAHIVNDEELGETVQRPDLARNSGVCGLFFVQLRDVREDMRLDQVVGLPRAALHGNQQEILDILLVGPDGVRGNAPFGFQVGCITRQSGLKICHALLFATIRSIPACVRSYAGKTYTDKNVPSGKMQAGTFQMFHTARRRNKVRFHGIMAMVMVQDIERALRFYRDTLAFTVEAEQEDIVTFREGVGLQVSPDAVAELRFDPNSVLIALYVDDVQATFEELTQKGVAFLLPPTTQSGATFATFRDTENNLLQLMQMD